jgi:hypothetical protein
MVTRVLLPAILVLGVVAAACGSDRTPDEVAVADDPTTTTAPAEPTDATTTAEGEGPTDEAPETTAPAPEVPMFGDLEMPCRPGDTSGYAATDQGVTTDTITLGTGDDRGFATAPNLNVEIGDAINAMVAWCNELGGINGRQIDLNYYDAAILDVNNRMLESCESDFMLVGQGYVLDGTGERTRVECGLYTVPTYSVSPEFAHGPRMLQPLPNPADQHGVGNIVLAAELFPEEVSRTAVMYGNVPATADTATKIIAAATDLGIDLGDVFELEYNTTGEDDWTPFVLQMKERGIGHLHFVGTCVPNFIGLMNTAAINDFEPVLTLETNFYVDVCAEANTDGVLDGAIVRITMPPFEEADAFPAVQQYLDLIDEYGGARSQLGMQAVSAFLLWATGADRCGAELTRDCVFDEVGAIDDWTGGGLHAASNPASNNNPGCEIRMVFEGTSYVRADPPERGTFDCDGNRGQVTGPLVDNLGLDENRVSTLYTG